MSHCVGELVQARGIRRDPGADRPHDGRPFAGLAPIVERQRQEDRPGGRLESSRDRTHERGRHVLCPHGLIGPLDPRPRHHRRLGVREVRLEQEHLARVLAGGDDERRPVLERGAQVAHRVAEAGAGVEVDERRPARRLSEAVGHRDRRGLLEPEDVPEVRGIVREERLLGRAEVAKDRRQPVRAKQVVRDVSNRCRGALIDGARGIDFGGHRCLPVSPQGCCATDDAPCPGTS